MTDKHGAHRWLHQIINATSIQSVIDQLAKQPRATVGGISGSSTALAAGALAVRTGQPVLLVVAHLDDADNALDDLELFGLAGLALRLERFGALEVLPGESGINLELLAQRLGVVASLTGQGPEAKQPPSILVAPIQALMQAVPEPGLLAKMSLAIRSGSELAIGELIDWLTQAGYQRFDAVEQVGQFAVRGGIVDIYPPAGTVNGAGSSGDSRGFGGSGGSGGDDGDIGPIRLDYFGDEIESIRRIDPQTMGSGQRLEQIQLIGASVNQLQTDHQTTSFLSLLSQDTLVVLDEVMELAEQARGYYERLTNPRGIYPPNAVFQALTARTHVSIHGYGVADDGQPMTTLPVRRLESFDQNASQAVKELATLAVPGKESVVVLCQNKAEASRLRELIQEHAPQAQKDIQIQIGYLHRGLAWAPTSQETIHLVPHHELFHRYFQRRRVRGLSTGAAGGQSGRATQAFFDLEVGDYVVHVDHGIARFKALRTMKRQGAKAGSEEYLTLQFADNAMLHVPATQIDLVQKYVGGFHGRPPLSTLGGKRWAKQKQKVAQAVQDMAAQLLRVQAARSSLPGVRYPPDTNWQREFEAEFPYDETEDQLAAIAAVKNDMHDEQPMDRLICGDVGFGKTEVAIRAAFKAVQSNKQVAVLVPTTVLAEQHERTFRQRMADYPVRVESLSRFKTAAQTAKVLKDLATGHVDIVIGTHRLISKDVKLADLGLVIIDEEQRFGVEHKHKLMQLRLMVDVLTLSATPIPRTLHMAMLGLRNISSLSTPPLERRAVVTEVIPYDEQRVRAAIIRELNRDGQVFFVHNRVHSIVRIAQKISQLVPEAKIVIGHGQMPGHELEQAMVKFCQHKADVLVSTTIIESGLDIPTANTIFINQADHFGLADLHQLRGRVGRYKHRAYCYLLLPQDRPITDQGARRLKAIEQYSMLGAGFKIAMRDLEIRGAGNLLGPQQSGHIATVGYEMYCRLLEQAARRLRDEKIVEPTKTHIELPVRACLPKRYITSAKFRMEAYRRLSAAATLEELETVSQDLCDAYGPLPEQAKTLLAVAELRIAAAWLGIETIKVDGPDVILRTAKPKKTQMLFQGIIGRSSVVDDHTVYYRPPKRYMEPTTLLAVLRKRLVAAVRQRTQAHPD